VVTAPAQKSLERTSLRELGLLFLRMGTFGFGGPAVHISVMQDETVRRRRWFTDAEFLDLLGATNLIPGPNSTEMAIHIGWARRRWAGLFVAGASFILPAMLITTALGWVYVTYGALPQAEWLLYGLKPVMVAVIAQAIISLGPKAAPTTPLRVMAVLGAALNALGVNELGVLFGTGFVSVLAARAWASRGDAPRSSLVAPAAAAGVTSITGVIGVAVTSVTLPALFWVFFKTGSVLFGSGYVLLSFLRADLVQRLGWLTESQLVDAIAAGQITPGPVFTTATFIGYVLAGPSGALVATLGVFLPAFFFVAVSGPLVPRLRASRWTGAFLDGVNVASLALMAVVTVQLGRTVLVDVPAALIALAAGAVLLRFRLNSTWLVLAGALAGYLIRGA
jgi:chromate transporter